jgi:hypothetical protein
LESELELVSKLELGIGLQLEPHLKLKLYKFLFFIFSKINLLFLWTRVRHVVSFKEEYKFRYTSFLIIIWGLGEGGG